MDGLTKTKNWDAKLIFFMYNFPFLRLEFSSEIV